jgi:hypothetical protein
MTRCMPIASKRLSKTHPSEVPRISEALETTVTKRKEEP